MSQDNLLSASISAADKTTINTNIANVTTTLGAILSISLTADDRKNMLKMGDKTLAFVQKTITYANQNAALVPVFLNLPEANKDLQLADDLNDIYKALLTLITSVEDALMISGSEAYNAALIFYASVKGAARSNVAGSQAIYDDLKQRFPNRVKKEAVTTAAVK